jgi:hypothetical protein
MNDLIKMTKEGVISEVNPTTVSDHQKMGFKVVDPQDLADLAKAGLVEIQADPEPYEKLIEVSLGEKSARINMATVQDYVDAGWSVVNPGDTGDLVTRGLLVIPEADPAPAEKLVRMVKVGDDAMSKAGETGDVDPSTVDAHIDAGWKVDDQ